MTAPLLFNCVLFFAAISTTLVAGLTLTFAIIIMPGIRQLNDGSFVHAFQVIDGVIKNGQAIFGIIWIGSALSVFAVAGLSIWQVGSWQKWLLIAAAAIYFLGVQLPTFTVNVPRNNQLQTLQIGQMDEHSLSKERKHFEATWNRWNVIRTYAALITSVFLLFALKSL